MFFSITLCRISFINSFHLLQICKKLSGEGRHTAEWFTNVGNELGQILIYVLTCEESSEKLAPMARYTRAGEPSPSWCMSTDAAAACTPRLPSRSCSATGCWTGWRSDWTFFTGYTALTVQWGQITTPSSRFLRVPFPPLSSPTTKRTWTYLWSLWETAIAASWKAL